MITYEQLRHNEEIKTYIKKADEALAALGYTEHSFAPVSYTHLGKTYIFISTQRHIIQL